MIDPNTLVSDAIWLKVRRVSSSSMPATRLPLSNLSRKDRQSLNDQHWHGTVSYNLRSLTPKEQSFYTSPAVRSHYNKIAPGFLRRCQYGSRAPSVRHMDRVSDDPHPFRSRFNRREHILGGFLAVRFVMFDFTGRYYPGSVSDVPAPPFALGREGRCSKPLRASTYADFRVYA